MLFSHLLNNPKNVAYSRKVNLSFSALFAQVHENSDFLSIFQGFVEAKKAFTFDLYFDLFSQKQ